MISRAGTARIVFQYIGLIPQIKNAEDAYTTPIIVRDSRLGFVFGDLIDTNQIVQKYGNKKASELIVEKTMSAIKELYQSIENKKIIKTG